jgi:RecB family exonuclease
MIEVIAERPEGERGGEIRIGDYTTGTM